MSRARTHWVVVTSTLATLAALGPVWMLGVKAGDAIYDHFNPKAGAYLSDHVRKAQGRNHYGTGKPADYRLNMG